MKKKHKNVKFRKFLSNLVESDFVKSRVKGDHMIFDRPDIAEILNVQPSKKDKSIAKSYQVKQFLNIIEKYNLLEEEN